MPLRKCLISPDSDGYEAIPGKTTLAIKLAGGAPRYRRDQLNATFSVEVKWTVSPNNYDYLMAFYRKAADWGSLPFLIDLVIDAAAPKEYTAYFVPETFGLKQQEGMTYTVGATLEVMPDPPTAAEDEAVLTAGPE